MGVFLRFQDFSANLWWIFNDSIIGRSPTVSTLLAEVELNGQINIKKGYI